MAVLLLALLCILGFAQGEPVLRTGEPAIIEDLRRAESRIVGGWQAQDGQFPYQVSVRMVSTAGAVSSCGGSVIHHKWVLTAAHCLANRVTFVVRLGLTNLTRPQLLVETDRKFIHPEYDEFRAGVQTDDIALLGLKQAVPYGKYIQPCRLQNSEQKNLDYSGVRLTVSGYGRTDDPWNGGAASEELLWVHLRGISNQECLRWYPHSTVIKDRTICAAYYNETSQSTCQGDSGGPMTAMDFDSKPTLVGVVSFGSSAGCNTLFPSGLVRPGHYHDWFYIVTGIDFDWRAEDLIDPESSGDGSDETVFSDIYLTNRPEIIEDLRQAGVRIVGGWPAEDGQFPYQVSLRIVTTAGNMSPCGGTLIHNKWVLTAAHCLANHITFVVRLGLTNLTRPEMIVETDRKFIHPDYIEIHGGIQADDIALVGLKQAVPYGKYIQPCRIQSSAQKNADYSGVRLTASGYGKTDDTASGGTFPEVLMWVYLMGISNQECRRMYGPFVMDQTICAIYYNHTTQSICQGDSGGPMTAVDFDGQPTVVGVVSFGATPCSSTAPSGLVRPGHYHDWYYSVTGINFDWRADVVDSETTGDGSDETV